MKTNTDVKTRKITMYAMLTAIAFIVMMLSRMLPPIFPAAPFLKYDPKDIVIVMGGFMFGPLASVVLSALVSIIEMLTVSTTGVIGLIMNILSTCAFACPAAYLYKKRHTISGAVVGLVIGIILMSAVMVLWNYLITPLYLQLMSNMELSEAKVMVNSILLTAILPFNLIKGAINLAVTLLIYKPIVNALRKVNLLGEDSNTELAKKRSKIGITIIAILIIITCVLIYLQKCGII